MNKTPHYWHSRKPMKMDRKVEVYRNLHQDCWSVRQDGIVVVHTTRIFLRDVEFRVRQKGRQKVIDEQRKNVHAFVTGWVCNAREVRDSNVRLGLDKDECFDYACAYYNPYKCETFVDKETGLAIVNADYCDMDIHDADPVIAIYKQLEPIEA